MKLQARNILFNIADWFRREIFVKRLSSPLGLAVLLFMALVSGFLAAKDLFIIPFALGGGVNWYYGSGILFIQTLYRLLFNYHIGIFYFFPKPFDWL